MRGLRLVLLHFGQHISHNTPIKIFSHPQKLWPRQNVIKVIFHLIIFGKTPQIALLHLDEIVDLCHADVHHCYCERSSLVLIIIFKEKSTLEVDFYCSRIGRIQTRGFSSGIVQASGLFSRRPGASVWVLVADDDVGWACVVGVCGHTVGIFLVKGDG